MDRWQLKSLYEGLDDSKYLADLNKLKELVDELTSISSKFKKSGVNSCELVCQYVHKREEFVLIEDQISAYIGLTLAVDATNSAFSNALMEVEQLMIKTTLPETRFKSFIKKIKNFSQMIDETKELQEYKYFLLSMQKNTQHLLSEKEEQMYSTMSQSGERMLLNMRNVLTATLEVDYMDEKISLSEVRTMSSANDKETRKRAYEAELASYKKIEMPMAFALNGYKKGVADISKIRNYSSVIDRTLKNSRIDETILKVLLEAMNESLPLFREYLKRKATLLGYETSLPFYELFAPIGKMTKTYDVNWAKEFILHNFKTFDSKLESFSKKVFESDWIDFFPRKGKEGGAFCASIYPLKEVRILTNFGYSIGDVCTLAHELGHAYHNSLIFEERVFNTNYPMPIAESASILCETIVKRAAIKEATDQDEALAILELELQDDCQVIVDIMSRYLFEEEVIKRAKKEMLYPEDLNKIMIDAQIKTYGDGLDSNYLHPYMWICKSHYYGSNFYNFPYAFGLLFSKGLYAKYLQIGTSFVYEIEKILQMSGKKDLADVAMEVGIDLRDINFWRGSIDIIRKDVQEFLKLTE